MINPNSIGETINIKMPNPEIPYDEIFDELPDDFDLEINDEMQIESDEALEIILDALEAEYDENEMARY